MMILLEISPVDYVSSNALCREPVLWALSSVLFEEETNEAWNA